MRDEFDGLMWGYSPRSAHRIESRMDVPIQNTNPHYTNTYWNKPRDIFIREEYKLTQSTFGDYVKDAHYEYSDRQWEWDYNKREAAGEFALQNAPRNTALYFEKMLQFYHDDPDLILVNIKAGVNVGNGYPYQVFGYIRKPKGE